jgi:hypothetical protein
MFGPYILTIVRWNAGKKEECYRRGLSYLFDLTKYIRYYFQKRNNKKEQ